MPCPASSGGCGGRGGPCCGSRSSEGPVGLSGDQVSLEIEDVVDGAMGGDETLGLALRLETLHFALASTDRGDGSSQPGCFRAIGPAGDDSGTSAPYRLLNGDWLRFA